MAWFTPGRNKEFKALQRQKRQDYTVERGECGRSKAGSTVNVLELGTCIGHMGPFSSLLVLLRNPSPCFPATDSPSVSHCLLTWIRTSPSKKPCLLRVPCLPMFFQLSLTKDIIWKLLETSIFFYKANTTWSHSSLIWATLFPIWLLDGASLCPRGCCIWPRHL